METNKSDTFRNLFGGTFMGFCVTLLSKVFIESTSSLHESLDLPKSVVSIPLSLVNLLSYAAINPLSDSRKYELMGGFLAIFSMLVFDEMDFSKEKEGEKPKEEIVGNQIVNIWGEKYPAKSRIFKIVDNQVYWMDQPIDLNTMLTIKRCLDAKGLPVPLFDVQGNTTREFLQRVNQLLV
jgi:hypothetical protein